MAPFSDDQLYFEHYARANFWSVTHAQTQLPGTRTHWLLFISHTFDSQAVKHLVLTRTKQNGFGFFVSVKVHKESRKKSEAEEVRDI